MKEVDNDYIPGTDQVFVTNANPENLMRDGDIVLVPQPTISPNDPLTWCNARKYTQLALVLLCTGLFAATSNSCGAAQDGIQAEHPEISDSNFNTADGLLFLGIGWWTLLGAPSVYLYGSRLGYLVGIALSIGGNVWYGSVRSTSDVVWSQLFIGASESVTEAVAQLSITQVFFQHQAQPYIGLYVMAISVGTFMGPLIGGIVVSNINWHWVGYVAAICSAFTGLLVFFGLEETYFDRAHFSNQDYYRSDAGGTLHAQDLSRQTSCTNASNDSSTSLDHPHIGDPHMARDNDDKKLTKEHMRYLVTHTTAPAAAADHGHGRGHGHGHGHGTDHAGYGHDHAHAADPEVPFAYRPDIVDEEKQNTADKPKPYWRRIAIITPAVNLRGCGFKQYVKRVFLYLQVLAFPPVLYSGLQWGAQDAWLSFYIDLEDDYYYDPPWNYSDLGVGIMNVPCLIGAIIGCIYGAWFSDWFVKWRAKRNNGVREAEMRLWCLLPAGLISPAGMFLLGIGTERHWAWYAPYVGLGLIGFGWGCCGDLSMSYLVDCYPEMVLEGMVGVALINNNIAMIFSFVVDYWMEAIGPENTFISIGVLNFFFVFLSIPMIFFGKRCRVWTRGMYFRFVAARDSLDTS